jgi:hypothetical protein
VLIYYGAPRLILIASFRALNFIAEFTLTSDTSTSSGIYAIFQGRKFSALVFASDSSGNVSLRQESVMTSGAVPTSAMVRASADGVAAEVAVTRPKKSGDS